MYPFNLRFITVLCTKQFLVLLACDSHALTYIRMQEMKTFLKRKLRVRPLNSGLAGAVFCAIFPGMIVPERPWPQKGMIKETSHLRFYAVAVVSFNIA